MFAGLLVAGCCCAATVPFIPLRLSVWCFPLLLAAIILRRSAKSEALFVLFAYSLFWMAGCTFSGTAGAAESIPAVILSAGLVSMIPLAVSGFRRKMFLEESGIGVIAAILVAAGLMTVVLLAKRGGADLDLPRTFCLLAVFGLIFFAAAGVTEPGAERYPAKAIILALLIPLLTLVATIAWWMTSAWMAEQSLGKKDLPAAQKWADRELKTAEALAIPGTLCDALKRQAEIAVLTGNLDRWHSMLSIIVDVNPGEKAAVRALFAFSLTNSRDGSEALKCFRLLPDGVVTSTAAKKVAALASAAGDWQSFARAIGILRTASSFRPFAGVNWTNAAKALYFRGDSNTAEQLFRDLAEAGSRDWESSRILFSALLSRKQTEEAGKILAGAGSSGHEVEAAYLNSLLSRARGDSGTEKELLAKVVQGDPEHIAARRRLKELGLPVSVDPYCKMNGVVFENTCRLVECTVAPDIAGRGDKLHLSFRWEVMAPLDPRWKVFVHMRQNVYGGFFFQADHRFSDFDQVPGGKGIGSLLKYDAIVQVPSNAPPGIYSLTIGIWDGTRNRTAVQAGDGESSLKLVKGNRVLVSRSITIKQ